MLSNIGGLKKNRGVGNSLPTMVAFQIETSLHLQYKSNDCIPCEIRYLAEIDLRDRNFRL